MWPQKNVMILNGRKPQCKLQGPWKCQQWSMKQLDLWEFLKKNGQNALCKVCKSEYAYHKGTVNLRDHLIRVHPSKLRPLTDQPCLNAYLSKTKCAEGCAMKKTKHIANMVGCNLHATAMMEGIDSYEVLWASISCAICDTYCWSVKKEIILPAEKLLLKLSTKVEFFAFTTENWTSRTNDAYVTYLSLYYQ